MDISHHKTARKGPVNDKEKNVEIGIPYTCSQNKYFQEKMLDILEKVHASKGREHVAGQWFRGDSARHEWVSELYVRDVTHERTKPQCSYSLENHGKKYFFQPGFGKSWNNFLGSLKVMESHGTFSLYNPCFFCLQSNFNTKPLGIFELLLQPYHWALTQ